MGGFDRLPGFGEAFHRATNELKKLTEATFGSYVSSKSQEPETRMLHRPAAGRGRDVVEHQPLPPQLRSHAVDARVERFAARRTASVVAECDLETTTALAERLHWLVDEIALVAGKWFALLWRRLRFNYGVHLRCFHYVMVSQEPAVLPDSTARSGQIPKAAPLPEPAIAGEPKTSFDSRFAYKRHRYRRWPGHDELVENLHSRQLVEARPRLRDGEALP